MTPIAFTKVLATDQPGCFWADRQSVLLDLPGLADRLAAFSWTLFDRAVLVGNLLRHMGLSGRAPVGQCWGGSIAIVLATNREDLASRLVVVEPANVMTLGFQTCDDAGSTQRGWSPFLSGCEGSRNGRRTDQSETYSHTVFD